MDLTSRKETIHTYMESADSLAEHFKGIGSRSEDINKALELCDRPVPVVVEIGCGAGREAEEILDQTPYYVGFDVSPRMIDLARESTVGKGGNFFVGDLHFFPFNRDWIPHNVDIIFAFASLLHADETELERVFEGSRDVLAEGGIFYISLKQGSGTYIKEDEFGRRVFYLYQPDDIERLAGSDFETVYTDTQTIGSTDWFTIALKKKNA